MNRTFQTRSFGQASIQVEKYATNSALAVQLWCEDGEGCVEPLARLSVNLPESFALPARCFYVKWWSENEEIVEDAAFSGWFKWRRDLPTARVSEHLLRTGVWELLEEQGEPFSFDLRKLA